MGRFNNYAAVVYLYAANLTLEQNTQPLAENVTGELATAPLLSGTADLSFAAFDPGSGLLSLLGPAVDQNRAASSDHAPTVRARPTPSHPWGASHVHSP